MQSSTNTITAQHPLWDALATLKSRYEWVELSFEVSPNTPYWHGFKPMSVTPAYTFASTNGVFRASYYTLPGQYGTHIDFPAHFNPNGAFQDRFGPKDCAFPLVVIDKSAAVAANSDYELSAQDILDFESRYGVIPPNTFVAFRSDWSKRANNPDNYDNFDPNGNPHYPGWSINALKLLVEQRNVAVIGHETSDTDSAVSASLTNMACENYVLQNGKLNVELLCNLDKVPPTGAIAFVVAPRIKDGVGFTARVFAIFEPKANYGA
jgi:kynurenine formamidase